MSGLRNTKAKSGTKTPDFFSTCVLLYFLHLHIISLIFFFTLFIMTGVFQKELRAQQNSYGHLITVFVSSGHFSHGGMQTTSELGYELYGCSEKKKKKGTFTFFCLSLFFQISEHVVSTNGFLSKLSLCRALALIALAQQGKQLSPKLL